MTTTFKPGQHPDADQLSAFIEQALPAHERAGVLAHLAVCTDCRTVVALALPEAPAAQPAPEPRRSSIFTGWMVFLPAAAAVAALTTFIFFVHRQGPALQQQAQATPAPVTIATPQLESAAPAQPRAASPTPQAENAKPVVPAQPKRQTETANGAIGSAGTGLAGSLRSVTNDDASGRNVVIDNQSVQSAPAQNSANSFAPVVNNSIVSQNQAPAQANVPGSAFHGGAVGGMIQSNDSLQQAGANTQNRQQKSVGQQSASQTVQVQAEAPPAVATESADSNALIAGNATYNLSLTRQAVPSGLPLLSSAARGPVVLAIDTHHSVFVSNDSGQHWKTVRAVWMGRAVMVGAAAPVKMLPLPAPGTSMGFNAGAPQGAALAKKAGISISGTVTDQSGAMVPGATVTVTDSRTGLASSTITAANGRYIVSGLEPDSYDLDASATGFKSSHLSNVAVTASNENVANFKLLVGAASETVTVDSSQASIEAGDLKAAPELKTAKKLKAAPMDKAKQAPAPLFEIVTDKGIHWASADGITWQPE